MPGMFSKALAETLRAAVDERGLTQDQVGELIGRSQSQVSKYLSGDTTLDVEELRNLCNALGLQMHEIVDAADRAAR